MTNKSYKEIINELVSDIPKHIVDLRAIRKRGAAPTQAFSDFLTHSEQGDWAEGLFFRALKDIESKYFAVRYGKADKITAGDPNFKKFYEGYQDELDTIGKRPDILLFRNGDLKWNYGDDISKLDNKQLDLIVPFSVAGLEIRSSAYLTKKFVPKDDRPFLSFTPKVEDLLVVHKWIKTYGVPHYYVQVFFDGIYIIAFAEILSLLKNATIIEKGIKNKKIIGQIKGRPAFVIEKNPKNQYKETIHIYLDRGHLICNKIEAPNIIGNKKELAGGRLLHYVTFEGGKATADFDVFLGLIEKPL